MRSTLAVLVCLLAGSRLLHAQQDAPADTAKRPPVDSMNKLILDHTFTGQGEFVRLFLARDVVYRAELDNPDVQLDVRGLTSGTPGATIQPGNFTPEASRGRTFYIRINADAVYEIRAVYSAVEVGAAPNEAGATGATRLELYRDNYWTKRMMASNKWSGGLELSWGSQSSFSAAPQGNLIPAPTVQVGGSVLEGCVAVRYGPSSAARLEGCAFGISNTWGSDSASVVWFYIEPRIRIAGGESRWAKPLDVGLLLRLGLGEVSKVNRETGLVAPGVYASYLVHGKTGAPKLVVVGAVRYEWIHGTGLETQTATQGSLGLAIY